jgi:hypothetical protein
MYSAHDVEMGAIQVYLKNVLNFTTLYYTPFASNIFFELYSPDNKQNYTSNDCTVKIIYNGHETNLNYTEFRTKVNLKSWNSKQISDFCNFKSNSSSNNVYYIIAISLLVLISSVLTVWILVLTIKKKRGEITKLEGYNTVV